MRRSFAPSQQFRDVVKKPRFIPPVSSLEKENEEFSGTKSTLSETLKSIRKLNASTDTCEPTTEVASKKFTPILRTNAKKLEFHSDINASTHVRGESNDTMPLKNVVKNPDSNSSEVVSVTSKFPYASKFPTKFISPVMKSKDASNSVSHSGDVRDVSANSDSNITSHYYSVVW